VWDDALGNWTGHKAKFVRRFADIGQAAEAGVNAYAEAVRGREFPGPEHTYEMQEGEWEKFISLTETK
jgi:3-methyl-2-oxobutanoate hydroxymethyltransferase